MRIRARRDRRKVRAPCSTANTEDTLAPPKGAEGFYAGLAPFSDFIAFTEPEHYAPAPPDWFVVIADIEGSDGGFALAARQLKAQ